jgi:hypothetical protein
MHEYDPKVNPRHRRILTWVLILGPLAVGYVVGNTSVFIW